MKAKRFKIASKKKMYISKHWISFIIHFIKMLLYSLAYTFGTKRSHYGDLFDAGFGTSVGRLQAVKLSNHTHHQCIRHNSVCTHELLRIVGICLVELFFPYICYACEMKFIDVCRHRNGLEKEKKLVKVWMNEWKSGLEKTTANGWIYFYPTHMNT